jgi:hypothetical protein
MPSQPDASDLPKGAVAAAFLVWNRRLHYYIGLYLLFFCWLFAFTGLLLNHPEWTFAEFWPQRVQTTADRSIAIPHGSSDFELARNVTQQLGLEGEIQWPTTRDASGPLAFQVSRPGLVIDLKVDVAGGRATMQHTKLNAWGVLHVLHVFTGVRMGDTRNSRDWLLTSVWAFSMDAVAVGLILMVGTSLVMWYRLKAKRRNGWIVLSLGVAACAGFVSSLFWLA